MRYLPIVVLLSLLLLAGCQSAPPADVTFRLTGNGGGAGVTLTINGQIEQFRVALPWSETRHAPRGTSVSLLAVPDTGLGELVCSLEADGKMLKQATVNGALAQCTAKVP